MDVFNRKNIITVLLLIGLALVIYFSMNRTQHGDKAEWMKKHAEIVNRRGNPDRFCIECHTDKRGETNENFCQRCHGINSQHKQKEQWKTQHGVAAKEVIQKNELGKFCLDCHGQTRETVKTGFCNDCHQERNIEKIK